MKRLLIMCEKESANLIGHFGIMSCTRIAVTQNNVVQEVRDDALRVHQLADRFEDGFEVVLLRLATHHDVEGLVNVFAAG